MGAIKFYFDPLSQPCRAVELFMLVNKIPFIPVKLKLAIGEHKSAEYTTVNPFQTVPAIQDGKLCLFESIAILRYLSRQNEIADHWYPKNSQLQAKVDEFLEWHHLQLRSACALFVRQMFFYPLITGKKIDDSTAVLLKKRMLKACDLIENVWLANKKFITGDDISVADLICICELDELRLVGYDACTGRPRISAWKQRVRQATNPYYDDLLRPLNALASAATLGQEQVFETVMSKL